MLYISLVHNFEKEIPKRKVYLFDVIGNIDKSKLKLKLLNVAGYTINDDSKSELYEINSDSANYQLEVYDRSKI
jgi:hypothetical protein